MIISLKAANISKIPCLYALPTKPADSPHKKTSSLQHNKSILRINIIVQISKNMAKEISATCPEFPASDELPEDQQQQQQQLGLSDSNGTTKHYQNLLEEQQRCGSPQYQEILPCKRVSLNLEISGGYFSSTKIVAFEVRGLQTCIHVHIYMYAH